ncbi:hypothetical protein [Amycolatopsis taiwanensis]|uniref:Uncharacterized protein n=1 Tax=Amycolatopsis taiwanensis TaxID=342230 RepID=A0A9W6R794_9PSEU|nr:hypothetical protein [Amycolatopsis taiwanensis]GLY68740.1 hypothetical protein Atai01_53590 [Amycolatopsis taiwanensis]
MTATDTVDRITELRAEAHGIGHGHGWTHGAFVDAYGGDPDAEPEVPARFAAVASFYTDAYAEGVADYFDDTADM